ncbi:SprT-like domain-containing protein [Poseidonibacter lekithochrous]|uniref:SprT-like domain-containing protein n=1 Tax=Poseidonibacter TaxID=2321187 RepID=UPI001C0A5DCB|nr:MULTISPECIES: SprT-like domain-containing protein [Poseidonibacter]MBU3013958.1 SprT-like domain-containing protein [Poseidonibacter lekithochrous]MDO6827253.1 SprT-like domain-containing protein [Poseidonibacter sp. 1_MG-2023]
MFIQQLRNFFLVVVIFASILLSYLWYDDYSFASNPLSKNIQVKIYKKHQELQYLTSKYFKIKRVFPIIVSDELPSSRFGMAVFSKDSKITIYLNKKRFKENEDYMINDVMPHEYAHAIMFEIRDFSDENKGHSKKWQNICKKLNGLRCDRFVNHQDILIEKTNLFK